MNLREYQIKGCDATCAALEKYRAVIFQMATGLGKTVCAAELIKRFYERTGKIALFLAHRAELIWQAQGTIHNYTGYPCGVEMAEHPADSTLFTQNKVIISTVQTQIAGRYKKRMEQIDPSRVGLIIVDEAHRAAADSYKQIIDYYKANPNLKTAGITATPFRADDKNLGDVFESIAFQYGILDGVKDGWLVDVTQQFIKVDSLDWSECRTTGGDLNQGDVAAVVEKKENIAGICHPSLEVIYGLDPKTLTSQPLSNWADYLRSLNRVPRRTIVFTATVKQAEECCQIFNNASPGLAEWVCGETDKVKRANVLKRFTQGRTAVVCNVGILGEGYNEPQVEVIIMAKATKSLITYTQQLGRATRPLPGVVDDPALDTPEKRIQAITQSAKPFCRIVDFKGNSGRHKLINSMHVLHASADEKTIERAVQKACEEGAKPKRVIAALSNAEAALKAEEEKRKREIELARLRKCRAPKANYRSRDVSPFSNETFRANGKNAQGHREIPSWMLKKIRKHGMNEPANLGQARVLYGVCKKKEQTMPIMPNDAAKLRAAGYNVTGWTQAQANAAYKEMANNGWKKPVAA